MHEVRATVPREKSGEVALIAQRAGIPTATVYEVFLAGVNVHRHVVSVEASTPHAKAFIDALVASPVFDLDTCSVSSREVRAIISAEPLKELTCPVAEPTAEIVEDLWQLSHVTPSYVARAAGGAVLLAQGVIENSPIAIVVAALFLPFLSPVMATGFGAWGKDGSLFRQGARAVFVSTLLAFLAGIGVAVVSGGPIRFTDFRGPANSFAISAIIGIAAGCSLADDSGRRYLIGVAAAVQFAIIPVWLGAACVIGLPEGAVVQSRLLSLAINAVTITVAAVISFRGLGLRRDEIRAFSGSKTGRDVL